MPTLIYNHNSFVRWDKDECDNYTITNIVDYSSVDVTVTDLTPSTLPAWSVTFNLAIGGANSIVLPGDGVFSICAVATTLLPDDEYTLTTLKYTQSLVNIGTLQSLPKPEDAELFQVQMTNGGIIYWSTVYGGGDTPADFGTPPTSYAPAVTIIQNWLNANGGGIVEVIPPGQVSVNAPWIVVDAQDWQLLILTVAGDTVDLVVTAQDATVRPVFHYPDVDCVSLFQGFNPQAPWITSVVIDGTEIITQPWDVSTVEGAAGLQADIAFYLSTHGGGQTIVTQQAGLMVIFEVCFDTLVMTGGNLVPSVEECDYIYEFCDMYACISRLMNKWLCLDPCAAKDPCAKDTLAYDEARRRAIEMSTMFFHALMPLVSVDRLWHLGNWDISHNRTCNINNILELFGKLRSYSRECGFDCCNPCGPCGSTPCDPCSQGGYSFTSPTPCGCK